MSVFVLGFSQIFSAKIKKRRKFSSRKNSRIFRIEKKWKERECEGKAKSSSSFLRKTDFISEQNFLKVFGGKKGKNIVAKWRIFECENCETIETSETYFATTSWRIISHRGFNQEKLCYGSAKPKLHSILLWVFHLLLSFSIDEKKKHYEKFLSPFFLLQFSPYRSWSEKKSDSEITRNVTRERVKKKFAAVKHRKKKCSRKKCADIANRLFCFWDNLNKNSYHFGAVTIISMVNELNFTLIIDLPRTLASQTRRKILLPDFLILRKLQLSLCVAVLYNQFNSNYSLEIRFSSTQNPNKFPYAQIDGENLMQRWNKQIVVVVVGDVLVEKSEFNPTRKIKFRNFPFTLFWVALEIFFLDDKILGRFNMLVDRVFLENEFDPTYGSLLTWSLRRWSSF